MKRSPLKRRTPLRSKPRRDAPSVEREPRPLAKLTSSPVYAGQTRAVPKTEAKRNRALLDMAEGRPCLLCPPGWCHCPPGSVVACHSNLSIHGKAGARKADDCYSVWGGAFVHRWLDQGRAPAEVKERVFMAGLARQVEEWQRIAQDQAEPERFRRAASWALDNINRRQE